MGSVVDYGRETVYRGSGSWQHIKAGVPGRKDRAKRECEGCFPIYRENRGNDRKKTCVIRRLNFKIRAKIVE